MNYNNEDIILINEAYTYLKEGEILLSIDNNSSFFKYKNNKKEWFCQPLFIK